MKPSPSRLFAAFAVVYVVWGSTYLAIRVALEAWPPFLLAGSRFLVAGVLLLALARRAGSALPDRRQWQGSAAIGALLFLGGNGLVCWAEQRVPSGLAALAVATVPAWMTLLPAPAPHRRSVTPWTWAGVALGLAAVAGLAAPAEALEAGVPTGPLLGLLAAAACWSAGSHLSLRLPQASSALASAGAQMLCGGLWAALVGTLAGEWSELELSAFTVTSLGAWLYLVLFGSVLALSAYGWLLRHVSPSAVGTYAFVNPIVAVALGWALGGESLGPRTLGSLVLIVLSVALILRGKRRSLPARPRLRAASLLIVLALIPAKADAATADGTALRTTRPAPGAGAGATNRQAPAATARQDSGEPLLALVRTASDPQVSWRARLAAVGRLLGTQKGRAVLLVLELRQGPLVIETPSRILLLRMLPSPRSRVSSL